MDKKPMRISTRLLIITGIFLVLTCAIIVVLVNYSMRQQALVEAESKMAIMAEQYLAIHTYFSQKLKPVVFELTDAIRPKTYFDPVWMSSTYAIREINKTIKKSKGETEYHLKDAAINARSPENEATPYEKEFLLELGVNPKLKEKSIVQMIDGRPYLVLLRRGEVMEAPCLRCHSSPDKAPADMVRLYGPKRSFNRKIGDWVQAVSIRVPLAEAYANANHFSLRLSALLLTLLFILFGILYFFSRRLMFKPLSVIHEKALQISTDEKKLGDEIPLPLGRELNELASAFNSMSKSLRYHLNNLETLVKERTSELSNANENLKIEINARKKSEQEVRVSEEEFKNLFDNMDSGVAVYTAENNGEDFIFQDFNKAGEQIDRTRKEKIIGRSVLEMFPAVKDFGLFDVFQRVWKTGKPEQHPIAVYKDERIAGWRDNFVYKLPSGEIVAIYSDETERKKAAEELQESEAKYSEILENILVGVYQVTLDGKFLFANQKMLEMFGYSSSEELERIGGITGLYARPEERPGVVDEIISKGFINDEFEYKHKDGQSVWVKLHTRKTKSKEGTIILEGLMEDVTEIRKMAAQLQQSQKMEAVGTLAGGIAHDFNNILAIILGNAELASDDVPDSNPANECLDEIRLASVRAKEMVKQLLAFSRKTDEVSIPMNMSPIIKESMKMLRSAIPTSVEFKQHISDDPCSIMGDASQINQIVMNLVTNAADAMSEEGGLLEVTLEKIILQEEKACFDWVLSPGPYIRLRMRNTGEGIGPEIMKRIFDPYYTTKEVGKGTGMGLSVVHGIVKRNGGGIRVESELGKGTLFEIYFPALEKMVEEEKKPEGEIKGGSERILFVDDEESMVNLNRQRLERLGYQVKSTTKPFEALEWFKADPDQFDVIITDMTMPRMTGDKLTAEVLKIRPHMPVIICTGYSQRMSAKKAAALGVLKYIEKPMDTQDLASSIREVLDKK